MSALGVYYPIRRLDGTVPSLTGGTGVPGGTFNGGTITDPLFINNATPSVNGTSGALRVTGGVGIGGAINVTGIASFNNTTQSINTGTGALIVSGGVGVAKNINVGENLDVLLTSTFQGVVSVTDATASVSTATGALVVTGGVGVGGDSTLTNLSTDGRIARKIRTTGVSTSLDNDYIINVSSAATITLPDITNSVYDGVTYIIIKATASTVVVDSGTGGIFQTSGVVSTVSMTGAIGERILLISNGINWYTM
jgi:hypothetical protein